MDDALRRLEREAQAAPGSAEAWGALAQALVRAGRGWDAHGAAARALALTHGPGPLSRVAPLWRSLLAAPPGSAVAAGVPWSGLRGLGPARVVEVDHEVDVVVDLGGGRALASGSAAMTLVDLLTRTTGWRLERRAPKGPPWPSGGLPVVAGGVVVSLGGGWLDRHDAASGEPLHAVALQGTDLTGGDAGFEDVELDLLALDARSVALVSRGRAVTLIDAAEGRVVARVRLDAGAAPGADLADGVGPALAADGLLLVEERGACVALGLDGRARWRVEADARGAAVRPVASAGGLLLLGREAELGAGCSSFELVDPADGRRRLLVTPRAGSFRAAVLTRHAIITVTARAGAGSEARCEGWATGDGQRLWEVTPGPDDLLLSATADVAIVTPIEMERGWLGPTVVQRPTVALDAATGARLWEHRPGEGDAPPRPVAGHLVAVGATRGLVRHRTPIRIAPPA